MIDSRAKLSYFLFTTIFFIHFDSMIQSIWLYFQLRWCAYQHDKQQQRHNHQYCVCKAKKQYYPWKWNTLPAPTVYNIHQYCLLSNTAASPGCRMGFQYHHVVVKDTIPISRNGSISTRNRNPGCQ